MKQIEFVTDRILDEVCDITVKFWTNQVSNATIQEILSYENDRVRVMSISHGMTFGLLTSSYGENYHMVFERLPEDIKKTKIIISTSLKFGFGAQWKIPSDILIKWANLFGLEPIDFGRKPHIITYAILCPIYVGLLVGLIFYILWTFSIFQ